MSLSVVASHYVASVAIAYSTEVLADSPLTYMKFDETSGTTAADSSGSSHPGTIAGTPTLNQATVMPAGTGSYQLNTTAKRVVVANGAWMNTPAFTIEAWIFIQTLGTSYQAIANRDGGSGTLARGWNLYVTNKKLNAFVGNSGFVPTDHVGTTTLVASTAYHTVMTSDGTSVKLYLNGAQEGSTVTSDAYANSGNPIEIGASLSGTPSTHSFSLAGLVDHVAYYGTALSAARIAAHYAAASVGP